MARGRIRAWLAAVAITSGAAALAGEVEEVTRRNAEIQPSESLLKWQQIPWVTDLAEGQRLARHEHRPIFLWVTGDDPLERC